MQLSCCHWINLCENSWRQIYGEIHPFSRKLLKEIRGCLYYLVKYKMGKSCRVNILTRLIPTCPPLIFWGSWHMAMPLWGSRYLLCGRRVSFASVLVSSIFRCIGWDSLVDCFAELFSFMWAVVLQGHLIRCLIHFYWLFWTTYGTVSLSNCFL